jgi:hypothetical protein
MIIMTEFSKYVTEYAKTNKHLRLDLNYDSIETARQKTREHLWLQDKDVYGDDPECAVISLDQAKWLVDQLQYFIRLIEGEEDDFDPENDPQEIPNDIDFDDYKEE